MYALNIQNTVTLIVIDWNNLSRHNKRQQMFRYQRQKIQLQIIIHKLFQPCFTGCGNAHIVRYNSWLTVVCIISCESPFVWQPFCVVFATRNGSGAIWIPNNKVNILTEYLIPTLNCNYLCKVPSREIKNMSYSFKTFSLAKKYSHFNIKHRFHLPRKYL